MRQIQEAQLSLVEKWSKHQIAQELKKISKIFDEYPAMAKILHDELTKDCNSKFGRRGLTAEQVLRCGFLLQSMGLTFDKLAFMLEDSRSLRRFARFSMEYSPSKSALHANLSKITSSTWEKAWEQTILYAREHGIETGEETRGDCSVTKTNIPTPTDSDLLKDSVRVLTRLCRRAIEAFPAFNFRVPNRVKKSKRLAQSIQFECSGAPRDGLYKTLFTETDEVKKAAEKLGKQLLKLAEQDDDSRTKHCKLEASWLTLFLLSTKLSRKQRSVSSTIRKFQ